MHHHTLDTVEVTAFCPTCNRVTRHAVSGKRRGPCLEHKPSGLSKDQERRQKEREREAQNPRLF